MKSHADALYSIFEQHLLNALVEEETTEEFLNRVVQDYLAQLGHGITIPHEHRASIEEDLRDEVLEMFRKKTYGHYSLKDYRKAKSADRVVPQKPKATPEAVAQLATKLKMRRPRRTN